MDKKKREINTLIKRKNLIKLLNSAGIKRIAPQALIFLENKFKKDILDFCLILKQELEVSGKKTLEKKDIKNLMKSQQSPEDLDY